MPKPFVQHFVKFTKAALCIYLSREQVETTASVFHQESLQDEAANSDVDDCFLCLCRQT